MIAPVLEEREEYMRRNAGISLAITTIVVAACGEAGSPASSAEVFEDDPATPMVEWVLPANAELPRRSDEEKQRGMQEGRTLPRPEFLQPPLDSALMPFIPALDSAVEATFVGGASDILPGLVLRWIEAFNTHYPNVDIEIGTPYAGSLGMLEVIEGDYDFVFVSRELKPTDISSFTERYGYPPLSVAVSGGSYRHYGFLDAIGFFVHPDNPVEKLSFEQIDRMFSSTRHRGGQPIGTWGDLGLGGEWAEREINLYGIAPWNGFEEFVRQRVLNYGNARGEWRDDIAFSKTAFAVAGQVAADRAGIGYSGLAYVTAGVKVLPLAQTGKTNGYIAPSYERVADATYPLSRLIYFNTNRLPDTPMDPVIQEFIRFILSEEGQQHILEHAIFLPLRGTQADASLATIGAGETP